MLSGWGSGTFLRGFGQHIQAGLDRLLDDIPPELETAVESGIKTLLTFARPLFGPSEVAEGFSLFPEPVLNVNDAIPEAASVFLPDDAYLFSLGLLDISGAFGPTSELFSNAVNLNFDRDADDDDAEQVLREIISGDGGAVLDIERVPGIDGVSLIGLTPTSYTLAFDNSEAVDVLTLEGPDIERVVGVLDTPANLTDGINNLSLVDLSEETVEAGMGAANPILGIADEQLDTVEELAALLNAALAPGDERVSLLSVEPDSFAVRVAEFSTGAFHLLIFHGDEAEQAVVSVAGSQVDPSNGISELTFAQVTGQNIVASGDNLDAFFGGPGLDSLGPTVTEDELLGILATADERPGVSAIDQGSTVRLEILGENESRDLVVFATTDPVPGGAYDSDQLV